MSTRLGISLSCTAVRAVLLRRSRVVWSGWQAVESDGHGPALARLVSRAAVGRFVRPRATIAMGLALSQLKRIEGAPAVANATLLARVVRENVASFFLRVGSHVLVSEIEHRSDGSRWAAAFDASLVESAVSGLRSVGIARIAIVAQPVVLATRLAAGIHRLEEDGVAAEITIVDGGMITAVRRTRTSDAPSGAPSIAPSIDALGSLGQDAPLFAAAYVAATLDGNAPLAWRPSPDERHVRAARRLAASAAGLFLSASLAATLFAPAARATNEIARDSRALARMNAVRSRAVTTNAQLRRLGAELDRIARFEAERGRTTILLGDVSEATPESTALVNLRLDAREGSMTALTPHAAEILPRLLSVRGMAGPRITGSITREVQGAVRLERATIRFRRSLAP